MTVQLSFISLHKDVAKNEGPAQLLNLKQRQGIFKKIAKISSFKYIKMPK